MAEDEVSRTSRMKPEALAEISAQLAEGRELLALGKSELSRSRKLMRLLSRLLKFRKGE